MKTKLKYKKGDYVTLKNYGPYNNRTAKVLDVFKDTYQILILNTSPRAVEIISEKNILKKAR